MDISSRINARLASLDAKTRSDIAILDFEGINGGKDSGQVLLSYNKSAGALTTAQVEEFFLATYGNKVKPSLASIKIHHEGNYTCASLVCNLLRNTRPISDATEMTRLNPHTYIEASTDSVWDVVSDQDGRRFMIKQSDDNLGDLIEMKRERAMRSAPKLANMKEALCHCEIGDTVKFYDNGIIGFGQIVQESNGDKIVTIKTSTGTCKVDYRAIIDIIQRAPRTISEEKDILQDYFSRAYGDSDFAKELTRTLVIEENGGKTGVRLARI